MNVAEILKYCPKGTKLYSTVFGEVKFSEVYPNNMIVVIIKGAILYANGDFTAEAAFTITSDGFTLAKLSARNKLFSFLIRKGYKYDKVQHNVMKQCFNPFDKVLVRNNNTDS